MRVTKVPVSDLFRRFADLLDHSKLQPVLDSGNEALGKLVGLTRAYAQDFMRTDLLGGGRSARLEHGTFVVRKEEPR